MGKGRACAGGGSGPACERLAVRPTVRWFLDINRIEVILNVTVFLRQKSLKQYLRRPCAGRAWRRTFPHASKDDLRRFLSLFSQAFLFKKSQRLCFRPDDRIVDIYRAIYPLKGMADALEWEFLRDHLKAEYHRDFSACLTPTLTLGELFAKARDV